MVSSDKCDGMCDSEWLLRSRQISRWLDVAPNSDLNIGSQVGILKGTFVGPWALPRSTNNPGPRPRSRTDTHNRRSNTQAVLRYAPYSTLYKYIWMCSIVQYVCVSIHVLKIQHLEVIYVTPPLNQEREIARGRRISILTSEELPEDVLPCPNLPWHLQWQDPTVVSDLPPPPAPPPGKRPQWGMEDCNDDSDGLLLVMVLGCSRVEIWCECCATTPTVARQWQQEVHDEHGRHLMTQLSRFKNTLNKKRGLGKEIWSQQLVVPLANARSVLKIGWWANATYYITYLQRTKSHLSSNVEANLRHRNPGDKTSASVAKATPQGLSRCNFDVVI